jgi:A/G-specific adenine glycosylase
VLSFAFRQRAAILDTNVARVLFRVFIRDGELKSHAMTRQLWEISRAVLPRGGNVFDFNQALMDLGALVCTARKPRCLICPMEGMCQTRGLIDGAVAGSSSSSVRTSARAKARAGAR